MSAIKTYHHRGGDSRPVHSDQYGNLPAGVTIRDLAPAIGGGAVASGAQAVAMGRNALASGNFSIALGGASVLADAAQATGLDGIAIGYDSVASGAEGLAVGVTAVASGANSSAIGYGTLASGATSSALGYDAHATGANSTAIACQNGTANTLALGSGGVFYTRMSIRGTGTEAAGAVTVDATMGRITLSGVLNAGAGLLVTFTNSFIAADSVILMTALGQTGTADATEDAFTVSLRSVSAGSCVFQVYNGDAANSTAAPIIHFLVL